MGETGIRILVRIMGLLLVALAMQFFVNGLTDLGLWQNSDFRRRSCENGVSHRTRHAFHSMNWLAVDARPVAILNKSRFGV